MPKLLLIRKFLGRYYVHYVNAKHFRAHATSEYDSFFVNVAGFVNS